MATYDFDSCSDVNRNGKILDFFLADFDPNKHACNARREGNNIIVTAEVDGKKYESVWKNAVPGDVSCKGRRGRVRVFIN